MIHLGRTRKIRVPDIFIVLVLILSALAGTVQCVLAEDWASTDAGSGYDQEQSEAWDGASPDGSGEAPVYGSGYDGGYSGQTQENYGYDQADGQTQEGYGYDQADGGAAGSQSGSSYTESGSEYVNDYFGFTRSDLVLYLLENQEEYLGTPYEETEGESQEPGADGHMQCEGFVWNVLHAVAQKNAENVPCWEGADTSPYKNGGGWVDWIYSQDIVYDTFSSKEEMLASGVLEKGDIIWSFDEGGPMSVSDYHHVGFFWGDSSDDDVFWHSSEFAFTKTYEGEEGANRISQIEGATESVSQWWVIKLSTDEDFQENLEEYQQKQVPALTAQSVTADQADAEESSSENTSLDGSSVSSSGSDETDLSGSGADQTGSSTDSISQADQKTGDFSLWSWLGNLWKKIISGIQGFFGQA